MGAEDPEPFWLTPGFVVVGADEVVGAEVDVGATEEVDDGATEDDDGATEDDDGATEDDDGGVWICWMWLALTTQETPGVCTLE